jgi:hypothetical protein
MTSVPVNVNSGGIALEGQHTIAVIPCLRISEASLIPAAPEVVNKTDIRHPREELFRTTN